MLNQKTEFLFDCFSWCLCAFALKTGFDHLGALGALVAKDF